MQGTSKELETVVMAAIVVYPDILAKVLTQMDESFFSEPSYKLVYKCIRNYYSQYTALPAKAELELKIRENYTVEYGDMTEILNKVEELYTTQLGSEDFAFDKVSSFITAVQVEKALNSVVTQLSTTNTFNAGPVANLLSNALNLNFAKTDIFNLSDITKINSIKKEALGGNDNPVIIKFFIDDLNKCFQYKGLIPGTLNCVVAPPGRGKLLANDTPILTKDGWKKHGDLKVGDYVIGLDGEFKKVLHVYPKYFANRCVEFSNGEKILCHDRHEWMVKDSHRFSVMETNVIEKHKVPCELPNHGCVVGEEKELPVKPYMLGRWLATDESFSEDSDFQSGLKSLSMCNYKFKTEKYIPEMYLTASMSQRLDLVAGLVGSREDRNTLSFITKSLRLRDTFCELISTFGWNCSISSLTDVDSDDVTYRIEVTSKDVSITKITEIEPVEGNCIAVDGDGMYLAGKTMLPTHNTTLLFNQGMSIAQQGYKLLHIFLGDMSKYDALIRYTSCWSGIASDKLVNLSTEELSKLIQKYNTTGMFSNIEIISYAADEVTASQLIEEIKVLQKKQNKHYDAIIVDYDENIASSDGNVDMYNSGGEIYNKLALYARENNSVIFIASQPKPDYWSSDVLPMESLAESSKKQKIVDLIITLGKPGKKSSVGSLHIAKNRRGEEGGIYRVKINGSNARIEHISQNEYDMIRQQERNTSSNNTNG